MQEIQITRSFRYNSITLPDPNPSFGPEQVREFYAAQYPELNNAVVEGPVTSNMVATYTFTRAAGAKGTARTPCSSQAVLHEALTQIRPGSDQIPKPPGPGARPEPHTAGIVAVALRQPASCDPLPLPSGAYRIWG